jgi:hypothetical protein
MVYPFFVKNMLEWYIKIIPSVVYFFCLKKVHFKKKALYYLPFIERGLELCLCRKDQQKLSCRRFSCMDSLVVFPRAPELIFAKYERFPRRRFLPTIRLLYSFHITPIFSHGMAWPCVPRLSHMRYRFVAR